jgi:hypothetical protein
VAAAEVHHQQTRVGALGAAGAAHWWKEQSRSLVAAQVVEEDHCWRTTAVAQVAAVEEHHRQKMGAARVAAVEEHRRPRTGAARVGAEDQH